MNKTIKYMALTLSLLALSAAAQTTLTVTTDKTSGQITNSTIVEFYYNATLTFNGLSGGSGGAISLTGGRYFQTTGEGQLVFSDNKATGSYNSGGAIYATTNASVSFGNNASFVRNSASSGPGGAISANKSTTISLGNNASFVGNTTGNNGGAISASDSTVTIGNNSSFVSNSASIGAGAISAANSTVIIGAGAHFEKNIANNSSGGAISAGGNATSVTLTDATFINNRASSDGGAIALVNGSRVTLNVSENGTSSFSGNTAAGTANGIHFYHYISGAETAATLTVHTKTGGVMDMFDPMASTNSGHSAIKTGEGVWNLGGTSTTAGVTYNIHEGTFNLMSGAVMQVYSMNVGTAGVNAVLSGGGTISGGVISGGFSDGKVTVGADGTVCADEDFAFESLELLAGSTLHFAGGSIIVTNLAFAAFNLQFSELYEAGEILFSLGTPAAITQGSALADYINGQLGDGVVSFNGTGIVLNQSIPEPTAILMLAAVAVVGGLYRRFFCKL